MDSVSFHNGAIMFQSKGLEVTTGEATNTSAYLDDIEIPDELPQPDRSAIQRVADCGFQLPTQRLADAIRKRGGTVRPMFHLAWEPLSYKLDFNPEVFTDNPDNFDHQWLTVYTNDGNLMGPNSQFGQVQQAFKAMGFPLTKNDVIRPLLIGKIFKTKTVEEKFTRRNPDGTNQVGTDGKPVTSSSWNTIPVEQLDAYTVDPQRRVIRRGYQGAGGSGITRVEPSAEAVAAMKRALHGKSEADFMDAIMFSGNPLINCDPFLVEAGDPAKLTERCVAYGGKVLGGKVYFAELE